jgi:uncharacterized protein
MNKNTITIGKIAKEVGVLSSTIRYYTNIGLIQENGRTQGKYRLYDKQQTIDTLHRIFTLKGQGLTLDKIKQCIVKESETEVIFKKYPVKFAYLFGSRAKSNTTSLSDVDIAVFLDETLTDNQIFDTCLEISGELSKEYKTEKIDLVVLNTSPLLLSFDIVVTGRLLYCANEQKRIEFEARTMSLYFDQQYYYQRHSKFTLDRIATEGIL